MLEVLLDVFLYSFAYLYWILAAILVLLFIYEAIQRIVDHRKWSKDAWRKYVDGVTHCLDCPYCWIEQEGKDNKQREGEWKKCNDGFVHCSECDFAIRPLGITPYCPHCGTKLKGADNEFE